MIWMWLNWNDWAQLWKGISPCMSPGVGDCVVWWEAWAVVVGVAVGAATTVVAVFAWLASKRAADIAADAKSIAKEQHDAEMRARAASARIIGRLLAYEVTALPGRLQHRLRVVEKAYQGEPGASALVSGRQLMVVADELSIPILPNAERVVDRIEALPDKLGADLATMISHCRDIVDQARRIRELIIEVQPISVGFRTTYHYKGSDGWFDLLHKRLAFVVGLAPELSRDFGQFVLQDGAGEPTVDPEPEDA